MNRMLNGLLGKGLTLTRGIASRAKVSQQGFVHPEKRRTFPIVYFNWKEVPQTLAQKVRQETEINPQIVATSGGRARRRKCGLRHFFQDKSSILFSDVHRWSEFRRKLIYGVY
ncbi:uncharacterized protein LOC110180207 [Drosophila serrata]|uniref:uncharacterized protein LOC110180207 n=1 Tax=Drosophila serrata TaxID=7274 RepID=UPI000A1CFA49|nr:uncharacterized protein LOC110180207 [Drosophila serrata]